MENRVYVNWPTGMDGPYYTGSQYSDGSIEIINNDGPDIIVPGDWCRDEPICKRRLNMIEPSDTERAELPETSARYIEDLEIELENIATDLNNALAVLSLVENKLYPARIQLKDAHKDILKVIGQNDFYKTDDEIF